MKSDRKVAITYTNPAMLATMMVTIFFVASEAQLSTRSQVQTP